MRPKYKKLCRNYEKCKGFVNYNSRNYCKKCQKKHKTDYHARYMVGYRKKQKQNKKEKLYTFGINDYLVEKRD